MDTRRAVSVGRSVAKACVAVAAVVGLFTIISWISEAPFGPIASNAAYAQSSGGDAAQPVAAITHLVSNKMVFIDASGFSPDQRGRALKNAIASLVNTGEIGWQSIIPLTLDGTTTQLCLCDRRPE